MLEESVLENGQIISVVTTNGTLNQNATAKSEIEIPMEVAGGIAVRPSNSLLVSDSVTFSDWTDTTRTITSSSDPAVIGGGHFPILPCVQRPFTTL